MSKTTYMRHPLQRQNVIKEFLVTIFLLFASYPRLLIEVFIRKNFGERYFKLSSAITIATVLFAIPFLSTFTQEFSEDEPSARYTSYIGWFIYLALFVIVSTFRKAEMKRQPSVYDFKKYSLYDGDAHPLFYKIKLPFIPNNPRTVETLIEPLPFLIAGIVLCLIHQKLGILLIICSLLYSLGYMAAYHMSDNYIMDKIDQLILADELEKVFVEDAPPEDARGVKDMGRKPSDQELRRKVLTSMMAEDEPFIVS